jgi:hypothetical protein
MANTASTRNIRMILGGDIPIEAVEGLGAIASGNFEDPVVVPGGDFSTPGFQLGDDETGLYVMPDGEVGIKVGGALIVHTSAGAGTGLRRDVGHPFIGGRVYVEDEFFVEDDFWADEGIAVTSANLPVTTTTLTANAAAGASTITVASVPGAWIVDKTIHLMKTTGTQYDRPRITAIEGNVITLDSPLQYAYLTGTVVSENPWRGGVYPTAGWPVPSGIMSVGADLTAAEAAAVVVEPVFLLDKAHNRYRHGMAELFAPDWITSGGVVAAAGGMTLSVSAATFAKGGDVVHSTAQTVVVPTAHASLPRIDIVVFSLGGVASVVAGTPNASPVAPTPTSVQFLLAEVAVAAAAASIGGGALTSRLARVHRFRTADPANGGWIFGNDDETGVRVRSFAGDLHIVEGVDDGNFSSLDLNPSGGEVTVGDGGLAVAGPFGANGSAAVGKQTLGAAASDPGTTQTLANNLRLALIAFGLGQT